MKKLGKYSKLYRKMLYDQKVYELRDSISYQTDAEHGTEEDPVNGLKGKIKLSRIIDIPMAFPIDYMHLICLGLFKNLLTKWFDKSNSKKEYYIGKLL